MSSIQCELSRPSVGYKSKPETHQLYQRFNGFDMVSVSI